MKRAARLILRIIGYATWVPITIAVVTAIWQGRWLWSVHGVVVGVSFAVMLACATGATVLAPSSIQGSGGEEQGATNK